MLNLPNVTLCCLTNRDFEGHKKALDIASQGINWGAKKIIWDDTIKNIDDWNYRVIYELHNYINTPYALLFHSDGYPIRADLWQDAFLDFDYIGAPWPLPQDNYSYRDEEGNLQRVGNSVSVRSKKLMKLVASRPQEWFWEQKKRYGNCNEDGFISCHNRKWLESKGCTFAPLELAVHFSKEHEIPENKGIDTFAFHTVDK